jgi:hypothetical protein
MNKITRIEALRISECILLKAEMERLEMAEKEASIGIKIDDDEEEEEEEEEDKN